MLLKMSEYVKSYDQQTKWIYFLIEKIYYNKEISKVDSNHTCLAVITLDSAVKKDQNYYPQVLLKECRYTEKTWLDILLMT